MGLKSTFNKDKSKAEACAVGKYVNTAYDNMVIISKNIDALLEISENLVYLTTYLGSYESDPTERPNGSPLQDGDYYFNTLSNALVYYDLTEDVWFTVDPQEVLNARDEAQAAQAAAEAAEAGALVSAGNAATSEANALASENAAALSETNAATSATNALASENASAASEAATAQSESNAATSATNAANSASAAATSESNAGSSEVAAANSAVVAAGYAADAEAAFDNFTDLYLGAKATDPTTDNDGSPLQVGATYWNSTSNDLRYWSGATWDIPEQTAIQAANDAIAARDDAQLSETNAVASEAAAAQSEANASQSAANASISETNAAASAASALNSKSDIDILLENAGYQGLWPDTGGSALKGETYQTQVSGTPTGDYYTALQNTSIDPVGDNVNWKVDVTGSYVNQAQEELINGSIFPESETVQNGDTIPVGTTHLRILVGGEHVILKIWDDIALPTLVTTVPTAGNGFSGYDLVTDQGTFELVTENTYSLRSTGRLEGWGIDKDSNNNTPQILKAMAYESSIARKVKRTLKGEGRLQILGDLKLAPFVTLECDFLVVDAGVRIIPVPNSDYTGDIIISGVGPDLFYIDGQQDNPRWLTTEFETKVKAKVSSDVFTGRCLVLDATATSELRGIISGFECDITLSRMEAAATLIVDNTAFTGGSGNSYITSNNIRIRAGGTRKMVDEYYSNGQSTTRPPNEEIAANNYTLDHQPTTATTYNLLQIVGRISELHCSFWDSHIATNNDQITIYGNDNRLYGQNFPAINSGYVNDLGQRTIYSGVSYGTPQQQFSKVVATKSINVNEFSVGGYLAAIIQNLQIDGNTIGGRTVLASRTVNIDTDRKPYVIEIDVGATINASNAYNVVVDIGGVQFVHNTAIDGDIANRIIVGIEDSQVSFSSDVNGEVSTSIVTSTISGSTLIRVSAYGSNSAENGFLRSAIIKGGFLA